MENIANALIETTENIQKQVFRTDEASIPHSIMFLNLRSQVGPIPWTTNIKWSTCVDSPEIAKTTATLNNNLNDTENVLTLLKIRMLLSLVLMNSRKS